MAGSGVDRNELRGAEPAAASPVKIIVAIVLLLVYQGYTLSLVGIASPWIAKSFHLDEAALARLFAWMSLSAFGALLLARMADRHGRRRIILLSLIGSSLCSAAAAIASNAVLFASLEMVVSALLGGSVSSAIVLLAEELAVDQRARGQAAAAFASAIGGVLGYVVMPLLVQWNYSWRWLLAVSAAGLFLVVPIARMLPGHEKWQRAEAAGVVSATRIYDVFSRLYRKRTVTLLACAALDTMAGTAVNGWLYFEAVSVLGLSPAKASTLVVIGMGIGMAGFPLGAWTSERFGRVPTVVYMGLATWVGAIGFYWPPAGITGWLWPWLIVTYSFFKIATGGLTVGANSAATELFPAALRSTMIGWQMITAAIFSMIAQIAIAALIGPMGGLTHVIRYFAMLGIPSAVLFGLFIDETRGLSLEESAKERAWARTSRSSRATRPLRASEHPLRNVH